MTSRAERLRHKRAARKIPSVDAPDSPFEAIVPSRSKPTHAAVEPQEREVWRLYGMTEKQEAARDWFLELRESGSPEELLAARAQITDDEYDILCEVGRFIYTARRTGRSEATVQTLFLSGLRKLVIYLATNDIAHGQPVQ